MRILVVGAGATGGYFGGRLLAAGRDVTFLVRPGRAARLAADGLRIRSGLGDLHLPAPPTVQAGRLGGPCDLVLLSCKTYDLDAALAAAAPAVGADTLVLPLLNGMAHFDALDARFGPARVLGGLCMISSVLDPDGLIRHRNASHTLVFGARDAAQAGRLEALAAALCGAGFDARPSAAIVQDLWEKWVFIAATAGITCLMRGDVGQVVAAGGAGFALALVDECAAIAAALGHGVRPEALARIRGYLTEAGSAARASLLDDLERGGEVEAGPIVDDLLGRGVAQGGQYPLLELARLHLAVYGVRNSVQDAW